MSDNQRAEQWVAAMRGRVGLAIEGVIAECDQLRAEVERLKAVLQRIPAYTKHRGRDCTVETCAKCMAMAALDPSP